MPAATGAMPMSAYTPLSWENASQLASAGVVGG